MLPDNSNKQNKQTKLDDCNSFVMTYVGVKCQLDTVVFYVTRELVVQRKEDHGIYEDLNLTHGLTQVGVRFKSSYKT